MTLFRTRYGEAVLKVFAMYPPSSMPLALAIETLIMTAMEKAKADVKDDIAATVCEGNLHEGLGKGLVCKKCHDALMVSRFGVDEEALALPQSQEQKEQVAQIDQQVRALLGED